LTTYIHFTANGLPNRNYQSFGAHILLLLLLLLFTRRGGGGGGVKNLRKTFLPRIYIYVYYYILNCIIYTIYNVFHITPDRDTNKEIKRQITREFNLTRIIAAAVLLLLHNGRNVLGVYVYTNKIFAGEK